MERILDFTQDLDIKLFDEVVEQMYTPGEKRRKAEEVLILFRDHPDSWSRADTILRNSANIKAKIFAVQVLEKAIKMRWSLFTDEQKEGVREYVVSSIISLAGEETEQAPPILQALNQVLIAILKREWPEQWPTFISDVLSASESNISLCENTLNLLRVLSDEVFSFQRDITSEKARRLREQMNREFSSIFILIQRILEAASQGTVPVTKTLISATLETLLKFIAWMPPSYVYQTNLCPNLIRYVDTSFSTLAIACITEIVDMPVPAESIELAGGRIRESFVSVCSFLSKYFEKYKGTSIKKSYTYLSEEEKGFVRQIALFYKAVYRHMHALEKMGCNTLAPLSCILEVSEIGEMEVFKICSEFWSGFAASLFAEFPFPSTKTPVGLRRNMYTPIFGPLIRTLVSQMSRPEEVLITENEDGEVVLERMDETELISHYHEMKETLFHIACIDIKGISTFLIEEAQKLQKSEYWLREKLNKICWAVGAISETMQPTEEREFLVSILRALLHMCEQKSERGDKAVVASGIMYVVGQYPRFLVNHWKFLKTVLNKLFEFMKETHEGVQDMACETLLKIAKKCGRECSVPQDEDEIYIDEVLFTLDDRISLLKPYQKESVYEALCHMMRSAGESARVRTLLSADVDEINIAASNPYFLKNHEEIQKCVYAVRAVKVICGIPAEEENYFFVERERVVGEMFERVFKIYEEAVHCSFFGLSRTDELLVRRGVSLLRREICMFFRLVVCEFSYDFVSVRFVKMLSEMAFILAKNVEGGDPGVCEIMASACNRRVHEMSKLVPCLLGPVLKPILMDSLAYEEYMVPFFLMVHSAVLNDLVDPGHEAVMQSVVFGAGMGKREVAELAIKTISLVLKKGSLDLIRNAYFGLFECTVGVALDKDHEGELEYLIESLLILVSYSIEEKCPGSEDVTAVLGGRLADAFPHLSRESVVGFIEKIYMSTGSPKKMEESIQDFRVQVSTI
jgi:exportin-1